MSGSMPRSRSAALSSSFLLCSWINFGSIAASIASSTAGDQPFAIIASLAQTRHNLVLRPLAHFALSNTAAVWRACVPPAC
jgi:hypothetical protein